MRATDEADRQLLADLEREMHAAPPAAVSELLALRRGGAAHDELRRFIGERLGSPISVRIAAMHWLNAVAADPAAPSSPAAPSIPSSFGQGGGPRRMQPIGNAQPTPRPPPAAP